MTGTLPVLDLARFRSADRDAFLDDLCRAAREVGFFTVVGHGIPRELTERLDDEVRRFFALPPADRLAIENTASPHFRGYSRVGTERTAGAADQREQIDVGPERAPVDGPRGTGASWGPTSGRRRSRSSARPCWTGRTRRCA